VEARVDSFFASAERANEDELQLEIDSVVQSPVVQEMLVVTNGLMAVMNEKRQTVAINPTFLKMLGIEDPGEVLGLRVGEMLRCVHAAGEPHGCGTTQYCSTCGAAVAIVSTLADDKPAQRVCSITADKGGSNCDISLLASAHPIKIQDKKFLLLFLQDITLEQLRASLERTFFHDIANMLTGLVGASEMLYKSHQDSQIAKVVLNSARRMFNEVELQKYLFKSSNCDCEVARRSMTSEQLLEELKDVYLRHRVAQGKQMVVLKSAFPVTVSTDASLALRVMCNMVTNAFEATDDGGAVKLWFENDRDSLVFCVWNDKAIPEAVKLRMFQRNFSTKDGAGRGLGTYSMRLVGEKLLGGKVSFTSSEEEGTVFKFAMYRYLRDVQGAASYGSVAAAC
jgi:nitrogen-specific signal transduction histidine kinase